MTINRINPSKRWSDITVFNGIGHFVEVAEADTSADVKGQTQQIFEQAEQMLTQMNSDKSRILSATIFLTDFCQFLMHLTKYGMNGLLKALHQVEHV